MHFYEVMQVTRDVSACWKKLLSCFQQLLDAHQLFIQVCVCVGVGVVVEGLTKKITSDE